MLLSSVTKEQQWMNVRCMPTIGAFNNSQHETKSYPNYR